MDRKIKEKINWSENTKKSLLLAGVKETVRLLSQLKK